MEHDALNLLPPVRAAAPAFDDPHCVSVQSARLAGDGSEPPALKQAAHRDTSSSLAFDEESAEERRPRLECGCDPPLALQLRPVLRRAPFELAARLPRDAARGIETEEELMAALLRHYELYPRTEVHYKGSPLPAHLTEPLLACLRTVQWLPNMHVRNVMAQGYIVISRDRRKKFSGPAPIEQLRQLTENLILWAVPECNYTKVALTFNFDGSPHYDWDDTTFQHVVCLGTFERGGQFCIETEAPGGAEVAVVDTYNRVARVDGRFPHWVRGRSAGGERYSVNFYCLNEACRTPIERAVHSDFRTPAELASERERSTSVSGANSANSGSS